MRYSTGLRALLEQELVTGGGKSDGVVTQTDLSVAYKRAQKAASAAAKHLQKPETRKRLRLDKGTNGGQ